jgi:hypothetical protein
MCTGRDLAAGVVRARLPYAKRLVSGNLVRARLDVCVRIVPVCGVRESVLFIGTQFSILYTFVYLPA